MFGVIGMHEQENKYDIAKEEEYYARSHETLTKKGLDINIDNND